MNMMGFPLKLPLAIRSALLKYDRLSSSLYCAPHLNHRTKKIIRVTVSSIFSQTYIRSATVDALEKLVSLTQQVPDDNRLSFSRGTLLRIAPPTVKHCFMGNSENTGC